jgi:phosphoenolpyruvate carboxylase
MTNENTQKLAEQIAALLLQNQNCGDEFLRLSLEKINTRLDNLELQNNQKSKIKNQKFNHPSQEKFASLEELADEIINNLQNEKACPYEPTSKPCDHCAMCNSRGF